MNYQFFFDDLVKRIEKESIIEIIEYKKNSPLSVNDINNIIEKKSIQVDPDLIDFYCQLDGVKIRWKLRPEISDEIFDKILEANDNFSIQRDENEENPFANINILPISDVFKNSLVSYADPSDERIKFKGRLQKPSEIGKNMYVFDQFSTYSCMALYFDNVLPYSHVLELSGHYSDWVSTRFTDFKNYIHFLDLSMGICELRDLFLNDYQGVNRPFKVINPKNEKKFIPKFNVKK